MRIPSIVTVCVLLAASVAAQDRPYATSADLNIVLTAVKQQILVGEFTKVKASWLTLRQVGLLLGSESLQVDRGSGFADYAEASVLEPATVLSPVGVVAAGEVLTSEYIIGVTQLHPRDDPNAGANGAVYQLAFPQPGTYSVRIRYDDVVSNVVSIQVVAPSGADAEVLSAIQSNVAVLSGMGRFPPTLEQSEALLSTYGGHKYLAPIVRNLTAGDAFVGIGQATYEQRTAFDFSDTVFAADEALWRARVGEGIFGSAWAWTAFNDVIALYPGRTAALLAKEELRALDDQPPIITVAFDPPGLWPPDGTLVPVRAILSVSDEFDPSPIVELLSITCDDGCDPVNDVQQATVGSSDVEFLLRATRTTGGPGRTYTVTYKARDSVGNSTNGSANVLVPHDQP